MSQIELEGDLYDCMRKVNVTLRYKYDQTYILKGCNNKPSNAKIFRKIFQKLLWQGKCQTLVIKNVILNKNDLYALAEAINWYQKIRSANQCAEKQPLVCLKLNECKLELATLRKFAIVLQPNHALTHFSLQENNLDVNYQKHAYIYGTFGTLFRKLPNLKFFDVSGNRLSGKAASDLWDHLGLLPKLETLLCSRNRSFILLPKSLNETCRNLREFDVGANALLYRPVFNNCTIVTKTLDNLQSIESLTIYNRIIVCSAEQGRELANAICRHPCLRELVVNKQNEARAMPRNRNAWQYCIEGAFASASVHKLMLCGFRLDDHEIDVLCAALVSDKAKQIANLRNTSEKGNVVDFSGVLTHLVVGCTQQDQLIKLYNALTVNRSLRYISVQGVACSLSAREAAQVMFEKNYVLCGSERPISIGCTLQLSRNNDLLASNYAPIYVNYILALWPRINTNAYLYLWIFEWLCTDYDKIDGQHRLLVIDSTIASIQRLKFPIY